ncbi:D-lactate dehydrogenase [Elusimicrobium posterum]|uniref:NAD(P)-dependent oxidoreductase n=1 Tax=Elusimicrobium posterum TaxID=3116653 RepID=UPI003C75809D
MKIVFFSIDEIKPEMDVIKSAGADVEIIVTEKNPFEITEKDNMLDAEAITLFDMNRKLDGAELAKFKNLKFICCRSTGFDNIDLEYCKANKIRVFNVPNYGETTVAEYTIAMILALTRFIVRANNDMKNGLKIDISKYTGRDLAAFTLGIIGMGAIGRSVAKKAIALGLKVIAYDPYPNVANEQLLGFKYHTLDEVISQSDIISLHSPSTKENYHLLCKKSFDCMKNGVYIINTARGDLIDNKALYEAMISGKVAGAALDVLEDEGLIIKKDNVAQIEATTREELVTFSINTKLMDLKNLIITPHIAFDTWEARQRIMHETCKNIAFYLNPTLGQPHEVKI